MSLAAALSLCFLAGCVDDTTSADELGCMTEHADETESNTDDDDGDDGDGDPTSGDGDPGEGFGCSAKRSVEACMVQPGCAPVFGHALVDEGESWCSDPTQLFLGCVSTLDNCRLTDIDCDPCPGGNEILCDGEGYWQGDGCVPEGFEGCAAPGPVSGDC